MLYKRKRVSCLINTTLQKANWKEVPLGTQGNTLMPKRTLGSRANRGALRTLRPDVAAAGENGRERPSPVSSDASGSGPAALKSWHRSAGVAKCMLNQAMLMLAVCTKSAILLPSGSGFLTQDNLCYYPAPNDGPSTLHSRSRARALPPSLRPPSRTSLAILFTLYLVLTIFQTFDFDASASWPKGLD
jgi:hypothetical protein